MKTVSIVIPNFNGKGLLETHLPSVLAAVETYPGQSEIVVVDDGSSDDSVVYLNHRFPSVRVLRLETNQGFGRAVNAGVRDAVHEIVLLLNNDVSVDKDFIEPLVRHFGDGDVFSVVARGLIPAQNMANESLLRVGFKNGLMERVSPLSENPEAKHERTCTILYACAGYAAYDRSKFLELGGFDDMYAPFFWEDVDLSYRSWKRGWWVLYDPASTVRHQWHGTIGNTHKTSYSQMIYMRNQLLFIWKNISDEAMLLEHAERLNTFMKTSSGADRTACFEAIKLLPELLRRWKEMHFHRIYSDPEIFSLSANLIYPGEAQKARENMRRK